MTDFLDTVIGERRADVAAARARRPLPRVPSSPLTGAGPARSFADAIAARRREGRFAVIAEMKRSSPALGALATDVDPVALARAYAAAGAVAISVLTEPRHWGGSVEDLRAVAAAVDLPVLYKDVVVDEYQVREARAAGAAAVLLIAEALDDALLRALVVQVHALGMTAFAEAHEPAAFDRAVACGARVVGVNARNLRLPSEIDRGRIETLRSRVRADQLLVAESGIASAEDLAALPARVDAVLVGTALMRAADPGAVVRSLASVSRAVPA
ncbi:MAG TPA: indole-3-glycerol phosphate synthase TrpC [Candidatus Limnocylindria bacterium]|nr:indole-3-glycerol phosphate synthase TrpC [Candidatus Limnocylindria bacterium]